MAVSLAAGAVATLLGAGDALAIALMVGVGWAVDDAAWRRRRRWTRCLDLTAFADGELGR